MKTVFDKTTCDGLINRINSVNKSNTAQWGKMNVCQMLKHCTIWETWILGKNKPTYKQAFIGRVFGKMALNGLVKDEKPMKRNMPSGSAFVVREKDGDVELEKKKWIALMEEYAHFSNPDFIHDFFGKMTKEEIGILAYKHTDHHLRQFNS